MAYQSNGLNKRVRRMMQATGITQIELAERTGLTQGGIGHIVTGRTKMVGAEIIFKLADALQCDARWLATGELTEVNEE